VPLNYFNIVRLRGGRAFDYAVPGYETCIVPATGTVTVETCGQAPSQGIGNRGADVWDGEPEGVYVPSGAPGPHRVREPAAEVFVAGARFDEVLRPFAVRADEIDLVQYGSDETKTHRKIKHILGQKHQDRVGRLLVSELYTVGRAAGRAFPSTSTTPTACPRRRGTTRPTTSASGRSTARACRCSSARRMNRATPTTSSNGSTVLIDKGYHPCCVLPGYEMYYFTILGGLSQRSLVQYFQPTHADQLHTIPGIMDMVAKFK
jgi:5-deoxy-glucuronate isomerase